MNIAVTYDNGTIFQHFGHTEKFKIYKIAEGKVASSEIVDTAGSGHGALAGFLRSHDVDVLICGGIGGGARQALSRMEIELLGGVSGDADAAVDAYLAGSLAYDPDAACSGHGGHGHGEHNCGGHEHGTHGCGHGGHEHEGHSCGHGGDHGCGGHSGDHGCGGHGCH